MFGFLRRLFSSSRQEEREAARPAGPGAQAAPHAHTKPAEPVPTEPLAPEPKPTQPPAAAPKPSQPPSAAPTPTEPVAPTPAGTPATASERASAEPTPTEPLAPEPVATQAPRGRAANRSASAAQSRDARAAAANGAGRYVVLGAGPAGVIAAETLRKTDRDGDILLINGEDGPPYSRMAIPYYLSGMIEEGGTHLRKTRSHFDDLRITVRHGRAEKLFPDEGRLRLADGEDVAFDRLLVATGATPIRPPIEGLDLPGVHPCWTLEDARAIVKLAEAGSHVVLLGAGFIGCIILEALVERQVNLTVVEMGDRMVPRMLNETAGTMLKTWCAEKGVRVLTSTQITRIERAKIADDAPDALVVSLDSGEHLPAHLVVMAAGVRSNIGFLEGSGIDTDQGILVNQFMQSNHPRVFAAGDVAQGLDFSTGGYSVHAVQPTAADHGRIAAINMAGGKAPYKGSLVMNVLDTVGLVSCSLGRWEGVDGGDGVEKVDESAHRYIKLQFEEDRLVGAITLGRTDDVGVMRGLIQTEVPLGGWKEKLKADPHRFAEAYVARAGS